ncbi:hypothetical protein LMG6871_02877 [Ralstonia edaphis]|uniref:hypothetical protein n=1 Tax=Ralstonia edaphi TaxID=3058599 RepID=UPI0028F6490D|nr:hypothetical protein [Ralstonia sp. LMG 6871]CAJ0719457.1 hypothetical protein LMG6871_02877 [Ralstonia sp. LMG 6871]
MLSDDQIREISDRPECMYGDHLQVFPFARAIEEAIRAQDDGRPVPSNREIYDEMSRRSPYWNAYGASRGIAVDLAIDCMRTLLSRTHAADGEAAGNYRSGFKQGYSEGYLEGQVDKAAQQQADPATCARCGAETADGCEGAGCGYLTAGNGEQQAEPGADELKGKEIADLWVEANQGNNYPPNPPVWAKFARLLLARAAQSGQRAGVAEDSARMDWVECNVHSLEWQHSKPYLVTDFFGKQHTGDTAREAIDAAIAAAPTQQEGE